MREKIILSSLKLSLILVLLIVLSSLVAAAPPTITVFSPTATAYGVLANDSNATIDINFAIQDLNSTRLYDNNSRLDVNIYATMVSLTGGPGSDSNFLHTISQDANIWGNLGNLKFTSPTAQNLTNDINCAVLNNADGNFYAYCGFALTWSNRNAGLIGSQTMGDGNWIIDINVRDENVTRNGRSGNFIIDTRKPVLNTDFTFDLNQEWDENGLISTGGNGRTAVVDWFIKPDQNITVVFRQIDNNLSSQIVDLNVSFSDFNVNTAWQPGIILKDKNIRVDFNVGSFDINFKQITLRVNALDAAGNDVNADVNINVTSRMLATSMRWVGEGIDVLDQNSDGFNFRDVNNFEAIQNFRISRSGFVRIQFNDDINLGTEAQAQKLMQLRTALQINRLSNGDLNIFLDSAYFNDLNKSALLSVYSLPYTGRVGVRMDEGNCGTVCLRIDYNATTRQLDINISHFTEYITDGNAPGYANRSPTGSIEETTSTTISLQTDEGATCKYNTIAGTAYASMPFTMTSTNSTNAAASANHSATVTGLTGSGTYNYYVKCIDVTDNISSTDIIISFRVSGGGTATSTTTTTATTTTTGTGGEGTTVTAGIETILDVSSTVQAGRERVETVLSELGRNVEEIARAVENAAKVSVSRNLTVEKTTSSTGSVSYSSKVTMIITNPSGTKRLTNVKVVEEIPKSIASSASQISSATAFNVLNDDPIVEFLVDEIPAGGTASINYTVNKRVTQSNFDDFKPAIVAELQEKVDLCIGKTINDSEECTIDSCNADTGIVSHAAIADDTACTEGTCQNGICVETVAPAAVCGNNTCETGETTTNCPADCKPAEELPVGLIAAAIIIIIIIIGAVFYISKKQAEKPKMTYKK